MVDPLHHLGDAVGCVQALVGVHLPVGVGISSHLHM